MAAVEAVEILHRCVAFRLSSSWSLLYDVWLLLGLGFHSVCRVVLAVLRRLYMVCWAVAFFL